MFHVRTSGSCRTGISPAVLVARSSDCMREPCAGTYVVVVGKEIPGNSEFSFASTAVETAKSTFAIKVKTADRALLSTWALLGLRLIVTICFTGVSSCVNPIEVAAKSVCLT